MSRTTRTPRPRFWKGTRKTVRDGEYQYHSAGCRHHGGCSYCVRTRTHASLRRAPIESGDEPDAPSTTQLPL